MLVEGEVRELPSSESVDAIAKLLTSVSDEGFGGTLD